MAHIRDPIHGRIPVNKGELRLIDHRVYQRLRSIKQLGFTDMAFPGATHTRFAHCLGAMHVGGLMFDGVFPPGCVLPEPTRSRLRQIVRLALMLHDVGHPPMSHAGESPMPLRSALPLACFTEAERAEKATHEDFTILLLCCSSLRIAINEIFGPEGIEVEHIAHLISGRFPESADIFVVDGVDYAPVLSQMVSGEMDGDRMDYLQRDAHNTGVNYGRFDLPWLLENLTLHIEADRGAMALRHRAVFAFEDFLLSRHHMFLGVYYHYIPVSFDHMLARYYAEDPTALKLPVDPDAYALVDDVSLHSALRRSSHEWAVRIESRAVFNRLVELSEDESHLLSDMVGALEAAGVDHFVSQDTSAISKYFGILGQGGASLFVTHEPTRQVVPIQQYSKLYRRYDQPTMLTRVYVRPDHTHRAREALYPWLPGL